MFEFAHPLEKLTAINIYCNSWYGSMLWDLFGNAAGCAFHSWNTTVKIAWGLDRANHTYFVDHLLARDIPSIRQQIIKRYIKFVMGLLTCLNPVISLLAVPAVNTVQSNTGRNISNMKEEFQLDPLTTSRDRFEVLKSKIPDGGSENLTLLQDLMIIKNNEVDDYIISELEELIRITCTG